LVNAASHNPLVPASTYLEIYGSLQCCTEINISIVEGFVRVHVCCVAQHSRYGKKDANKLNIKHCNIVIDIIDRVCRYVIGCAIEDCAIGVGSFGLDSSCHTSYACLSSPWDESYCAHCEARDQFEKLSRAVLGGLVVCVKL